MIRKRPPKLLRLGPRPSLPSHRPTSVAGSRWGCVRQGSGTTSASRQGSSHRLRSDGFHVVPDMRDAVPIPVACRKTRTKGRQGPCPRLSRPWRTAPDAGACEIGHPRGRPRPRLRRSGVIPRECPADGPPRVLTVRSRPADPSPARVRPAGTCDSSRRTPSSACTPASPRRCSCRPPPVTARRPRDGTRW